MFEIIIIVILVVLIAGTILWFFFEVRNYRSWITTENPRCPTISCGKDAKATDHSCATDERQTAFPAYRKKTDGTIECQSLVLDPWVIK